MIRDPAHSSENARAGTGTKIRRCAVVQGEAKASDDCDVVFTTILGSCVAVCLFDPVLRVGGMNHFLLPGRASSGQSMRQESYGFYLMELLVNAMMKLDARRDRLSAKIFGGAQTVDYFADIGSRNVECARRFVEAEGIALTGISTGGHHGRRVEFWPTTGRARQRFASGLPAADKHPADPGPVEAPAVSGTLELF